MGSIKIIIMRLIIDAYGVDKRAATIWSLRRNAFLQFIVEVFVINISVLHQAVPLQHQHQSESESSVR